MIILIASACTTRGKTTNNRGKLKENTTLTNNKKTKHESKKSFGKETKSTNDSTRVSVETSKTIQEVSNTLEPKAYFTFMHGNKMAFEPPLDLFYIVFNYNPSMKTLSSADRESLNLQLEKDLTELGLVRLQARRNVYRMVKSKYTRTQLVKKLLQKKEVKQLEAVYSVTMNDRYFESAFNIEFKEGMTIEQAKKIIEAQHIQNFTLFFNEAHQLIGRLEFETKEMLSYQFLVLADKLSKHKNIAQISTTDIQHALPD
ncbi:MAG: hypothetical protein E6Q38_02425 [Crocinitomicaceae bacterium]|nr:MAG: hypothetical protein E6Q38_02425 [Crocinitomicaceae bacterium]